MLSQPVFSVTSWISEPGLGIKNGDVTDGKAKRRVTMWNPIEKRKLSGNAAPFESNVRDYLLTHPVRVALLIHSLTLMWAELGGL